VAVNAAAKADKSLPAATRNAAQAGQGRFYDALTDLFVGAKVEGQPPVYSTQRAACRDFRSDLDFPVSPVNLSVE